MSAAGSCHLYDGEMFMSSQAIMEPKLPVLPETAMRRAETCCKLGNSEQKAICPLKRDKSVARICASKSAHARAGRGKQQVEVPIYFPSSQVFGQAWRIAKEILPKWCKSCMYRKFLWQTDEEAKRLIRASIMPDSTLHVLPMSPLPSICIYILCLCQHSVFSQALLGITK